MKTAFACLAVVFVAAPLCAQDMPISAPPPPTAAASPHSETPEQAALVRKSKQGGDGMLAFMRSHRELARTAGFRGETGMAHYFNEGRSAKSGSPASIIGAQDESGNVLHAGRLWRWASVTKQIIAVLVLQEVVAGRIKLDDPVGTYLPNFKSINAQKMTVRELLRHQSGLPNPNDTPAEGDGVPAFYKSGFAGSRDPISGYCAGTPKSEPGGEWSYNNCDYMVAGALLEAVTGKSWQTLVNERVAKPFMGMSTITASPPAVDSWPGFVGGKAEPKIDVAIYGAAGAIYGTVSNLLWFDIHLATGRFLPQKALAELWDGRPELGFLALGQWSFEASLKGCEQPLRIVERRGAIGGVQVRNLIVPEKEIAVALFTDQAEFDFGEIWQGKGFSYEMLSLAACAKASA